jgi:hypothetical protein
MQPFTEAWLVIGRHGGKSQIAAPWFADRGALVVISPPVGARAS